MKIARHTFESFVQDGIEALPLWVRGDVASVAFVVDDTSVNIDMFGQYEGVPLTERGDTVITLPDKITIYMHPIINSYGDSVTDVRECVMNTVWHEVAHFLGHDEEWVSREEEKRGKTL